VQRLYGGTADQSVSDAAIIDGALRHPEDYFTVEDWTCP
jgi:hypothetical protein